MSLNVYLTREEVPKDMILIDVNDVYFNNTSIGKSKFEKGVLRGIDNVERASSNTFRHIISGNELPKFKLSTGVKTLLNIYNHPEKCFNTVECGSNALEYLCDLTDGNVLWQMPICSIMRDSEDCDILCRGVHWNNIVDFLDWYQEEGYLNANS